MIDYITAKDGGIQMFVNTGPVGFARNPNAIAYVLETIGIADSIYGSSTMDFASEEGFATDNGATDLWNEAIAIYNWNVNKIA